MISEQEIYKTPYKPRDYEKPLYDTHSTIELMRYFAEQTPILYKSMKHHQALDESLSPHTFYHQADKYYDSVFYATEAVEIDLSIFEKAELEQIKGYATDRLEEYQSFVEMNQQSAKKGDPFMTGFYPRIEQLKKHLQKIETLIQKQSQPNGPQH